MDQLSLSTEDKLLLYCSRLTISEDIEFKIEEILSNALDWDYIIDCSMKQGISPLFYWNLEKINSSKDVPLETMEKLKKIYFSNIARNILLYEELSKVLVAFKKVGIDVIVLKGAFLAEQIYKNIGLRPMSDIDLLVKEKDIHKAKSELIKLMYSPTIIFPTKLHEQQFQKTSEELPFLHKTKKVTIEIHWDIQSPMSLNKVDINRFWDNAKPAKVAGIETLTFAPENLLQHLCIHVDKHITLSCAPPAKPLRDFCDIAEVIRHYQDEINWDYLLQSSKDYKIEEPVYQGLFIAKKYFEAFVPDKILKDLKSAKSYIDFEGIFKGIIKEEMKDDSSKKNQMNTISYLADLKKVNRTWNKLRIVCGDVFPSKEFMRYRYSIKNEKQIYLYHLIRLGAVLHFGLPALWQFPHYIFRSILTNNFRYKY